LKQFVLGAAAGVAGGLALVVRATLRAPVLEGDSSLPWLVSSIPSTLHVLIAVVLSGSLGVLLARRGRCDLLTPFLPCGLAAAVFIPGVFTHAPFLAAFAERFLDVLLLVALAVALSRLARGFSVGTLAAWKVGLAGFILYLAVGAWVSSKVGLSGDEPHYLLITYSLLHDRDFEVQNNYSALDHQHFYRGKIEPRLASGTPYSVHGIGLPLLLLPGFAAFGLIGVLLTEALLSALLLCAIYQASLRMTSSASASLAAALGFGLTSPALFLSVSAYPELPAALIASLTVLRLSKSDSGRGLSIFGYSLALGALPFFHVKFLPLAVLLIAAFAFELKGKRLRVWLAAGAGISMGAFLLFTLVTFGSLDPTASYGRQRIFLDRVPLGIAGLLFDQEYGLLLHAPFYLLGFAGIVTLFRRRASWGLLTLLALLSISIPGAAHPLWSGGTSPPARFLLPALPLLSIAAAALLSREREIGVGRLAPWLFASSIVLALSMLFLPGGPFFLNARDGTGRIWEALSTPWNVADYLPSLVRADLRSIASACALFVFFLAAVGAQILRIRGIAAASVAGVLLLGAWAHDITGVPHSTDLEPHWVSRVMHNLSERGEGHFLALPSFETLSGESLAAQVSLRLEAFPDDGDPRHWWSRAYSLPAGRFRLSGAGPEGVTFFNGESAFQSGSLEFSSAVALDRFRLRARRPAEPPRLFLLEPRPPTLVAVATLAGDGARLHAVDDEAYPDPAGFWVRKGSRATFAIEVETVGRQVGIQIANGGAPNVVHLRSATREESFRLGPFEERELGIVPTSLVESFSVESESGFRPHVLDPLSRDRRELGARVRVRPAFD
jgi:hypothetical protein